MEIKLLNEVSWGGNQLAPVVYSALKALNLNCGYELIENDELLKKLKIDKPPVMMIDGKIVIQGRIPSLKEVKDILKIEMLESKG